MTTHTHRTVATTGSCSPGPSSPARLTVPTKGAATTPLNTGMNGNNGKSPARARINSRDIPRSYSGLYGQGGDDLLPFELARNWHTDWLENGGLLLLGTYLG